MKKQKAEKLGNSMSLKSRYIWTYGRTLYYLRCNIYNYYNMALTPN